MAVTRRLARLALAVPTLFAVLAAACSSADDATNASDGGADAHDDGAVSQPEPSDAGPDTATPSDDGGVGEAGSDAGGDGGSDAGGDAGGDAAPANEGPLCGSPSLTALADDAGATPLLDVGHAAPVRTVLSAGDRALTVDDGGHWNLWNKVELRQLANGDGVYGSFTLAGAAFAFRTATGAEVRAVADGHLLFALPAASYAGVGVATDGSYVWATTTTALSAWSTAGALRFTRAGNYAASSIFAASDEVDVANGPAGATYVERLTAADGTRSLGAAMTGTFRGWFADRPRLIMIGTGVQRVYERDGTVTATLAASDPSLYGFGDYVWLAVPYTGWDIPVYDVRSPSSPTVVTGSRNAVLRTQVGFAMYDGYNTVINVDLRGTSLVKSSIVTGLTFLGAFDAEPSGAWMAGNGSGNVELLGTTSSPTKRALLGCGNVAAIAGTGAMGTGAAAALGFDAQLVVVDTSSSPVILHRFATPGSKVAITRNGMAVAAAGGPNRASTDETLHLFALPSEPEVHAWPGDANGERLDSFVLGGEGTRVARITYRSEYARHVTDGTGATTIFADTGVDGFMALSPNGSLLAVNSMRAHYSDGTAQIYKDGALVNGVPGYAIGWIDDGHLLVQSYGPGTHPVYAGSAIYDALGNLLASPALPEMLQGFDVISASRILSRIDGKIYDLGTGAAVGGPGTVPSAVAGASIVRLKGHLVVRQPY